MATYTKEEAKREWERYVSEQTAATEARLREQEETRRQAEQKARQSAALAVNKAEKTARATYDGARVRQLAAAYRLAQQIADRGGSRGGERAAASAAVTRQLEQTARTAFAVRDAARAAADEQLQTTITAAQNRYVAATADAKRKLAQNLEKKKLTLQRSTKEETS